MTAYGPLFMECAALLLIWSVATVLSAPLRRRLRYEPDQRRRTAQLPLDLLAHVSRPALVILLTEAALLGLRTGTAGAAWLDAHPSHVSAWLMFWIGVGILLLADGTAHAVFHLRGRDFPIPDLLLDIIRALAVVAIGFGVLSAEMGVDIGPLLASTALLTAVVGFALQGVLGNLLAGMSLHLVRLAAARRLGRDRRHHRQGGQDQLARDPPAHPGRAPAHHPQQQGGRGQDPQPGRPDAAAPPHGGRGRQLQRRARRGDRGPARARPAPCPRCAAARRRTR